MAVPLSNLSATWTSAGGNTAIKVTIVDTANNANSNLINFLVNGDSKFRVDRNGNIYANSNSNMASDIQSAFNAANVAASKAVVMAILFS